MRSAGEAARATGAAAGEGPTARIELPILSAVPGLFHGFTLRGSDPAAVVREAAGRDLPLRTLRQVHGAVVHVEGAAAAAPRQGDALICREPGVAVGVHVADCLPILLCDPRRRAVAAVHAGWRGTAAGVLGAAIAAMRSAWGVGPDDLRAALGPCIGPCCFEVGDEVVRALLARDAGAGECVVPGRAKPHVDLAGMNRRQAIAAGLDPARIETSGACTFCGGERFESYRARRGSAGRMTALIGWRTAPPGAAA